MFNCSIQQNVKPGRTNLVTLPPVGHVGPEFLVTHHLPHLLYGRVGGHQVVVGQLVLLVDAWRRRLVRLSVSVSLLCRQTDGGVPIVTSSVAAPSDLPVHQAQSVDVGTLEGIKVLHVDGLVQDLGSHVPAGGHDGSGQSRTD